jgi:E3 ISG15--protein ligase
VWVLSAADESEQKDWLAAIRYAMKSIKEVFAWGDGSHGQLGLGNDLKKVFEPRALPSFRESDVVLVSCAKNHALALMTDGRVYSWGSGSFGQLGLGDAYGRLEPCLVESFEDLTIRQVDACESMSAAVTEEGELYLWGDVAKLYPASEPLWVPRAVKELLGKCVRQVSCGPYHIAVVTDVGQVYTWGEGFAGQLGLGDTRDRSLPCLVSPFA